MGSSIFRSGHRSTRRRSERFALARAANSPGYPFTADSSLASSNCVLSDAALGAVDWLLMTPCPSLARKNSWPGSRRCSGSVPMILWSIQRWRIRPTWWAPRSQAVAPSPATTLISFETPGRRLDQFAIEPDRSDTSAEALKHRVTWARERGSLVASDECYGEFGWEAEPISVLHPSISGGRHDGLLAALALQALQLGGLPGRVRRR